MQQNMTQVNIHLIHLIGINLTENDCLQNIQTTWGKMVIKKTAQRRMPVYNCSEQIQKHITYSVVVVGQPGNCLFFTSCHYIASLFIFLFFSLQSFRVHIFFFFFILVGMCFNGWLVEWMILCVVHFMFKENRNFQKLSTVAVAVRKSG